MEKENQDGATRSMLVMAVGPSQAAKDRWWQAHAGGAGKTRLSAGRSEWRRLA
jgi:hypothetical protein